MTIPRDFRRTAKPCPFKTFHNSLTHAISTLARPTFNYSVVYHLHNTGGEGGLVMPGTERSGQADPLQRQRVTEHAAQTTILASLVTSSYLLCFPCIRTPVSYLSCFPYLRKNKGVYPTQKCRRADIFDFSPDFSHFPIARHLPASEGGRCTRAEPIPLQRKPRSTGRASPFAGRRSLGTGHRPLLRSPCRFHHHSTPRLLRQAFPKWNLSESRQVPGARPAGMPAIAYRCPDAHD
jgi:hypothetical protein